MYSNTSVIIDQNGVKRIAPYSIHEDYSSYENDEVIEKLTSMKEGIAEKCEKERQMQR